MTGNEALVELIDVLSSTGITYMVVGSYSSNIWGIPRSTKDADLVMQLESSDLAKMSARLRPGFRLDPQMSFETITGTYRHILTTPARHFVIEMFLLSDDEHDRARLARRKLLQLVGRDVWVASAEDVIITKLRWSQRGKREKDVLDVRNVISIRQAELDWSYVESWCEKHGTRGLLEEIRRSASENPA